MLAAESVEVLGVAAAAGRWPQFGDGVLAEQGNVDIDAAFARMRGYARNGNI